MFNNANRFMGDYTARLSSEQFAELKVTATPCHKNLVASCLVMCGPKAMGAGYNMDRPNPLPPDHFIYLFRTEQTEARFTTYLT